ncbi:1394_t:CDS:10 [Cetraspora pellucida]|uniref:ATP-dependent DNA helicase n=1 Tax=Cetraspora pellucida TaxID=1433469 RepID=A0A9N9HMS9_9GLOM|nr:1394_t:CDS:10 [Cetraspora pellucida]
MFANGNLVFISGKYVVENSKPCFTIAYSSIIDNESPNRKFDMFNVPISIPHCIYSAIVNRKPKKIEEFIQFGVNTIEYNSVTSKPYVKIDMMIIYLLKSPKFKYLGVMATKRKSHLFRKSENTKRKNRITNLRQNNEYVQTSNIARNNRRKQKKMNQEFDKTLEQQTMWPQQVNPDIARNALAEFHNKTSLNKSEISEALLLTTTVVDIDSREAEHYTESDSEIDEESDCDDHNLNKFINNNSINNVSNLRTSGILHVDNIPITKKELILYSLQKLVERSNQQSLSNNYNTLKTISVQPLLIHILHSNKLLNEYEDPTLFPAGFPVLYPYGVGAMLISTLNFYDIKLAIEQEQNKQNITNLAILELLKNVNAAGSKLMASHQSQAYPSAVVKYFDIIIWSIINTLIGYNKENSSIFGFIKNYYSVIEYQDHGTPHCHMLVWLYNASDLITLCNKNKYNAEFSQHLLHYVSNIVREDISYLLRKGEILTDDMLKAKYSSPKTIFEKVICTLFHHCNRTCTKYNHGLQKHCRFDFPRELVDPPGIILPDLGIIVIQQTNAFINNHNLYITAACRGNNDIKFIATQKLDLAYIYYITKYDADDQYDLFEEEPTDINFSENIAILNLAIIVRSAPLTITNSNKTIDPLEKFASGLNEEQKKAYFLVCDHYRRNQPIFKCRPSQLLFYLADAEGTSKSRVIQAISSCFGYTSQCQTLLILAPTGIAAANVYGSTIHFAYSFSFGGNSKKPAFLVEETLCQLQELWSVIEYVILEEVCMISQNLLAQFHAFMKKLKATDNSMPFAGINIMFVDSYNRTILIRNNHLKFLSMSDMKDNALCGILPLSINMKVVITVNICANDNLANGLQSILQKIVYDKDFIDLLPCNEKAIILKSPPKYIIIELIGRTPGPYQDLQTNHIPIYPIKHPASFAFTDYKLQGRTLQKAIIDLTSSNTCNGLYIMLSHIQRLNDLLILQPFNESILNMQIPPTLHAEFERFDECTQRTAQLKKWPNV